MKKTINPIIDTLPNSDNAGLGCLCIGGRYFIMEEIWKDVSGYEGQYQISNIGRVKSLSRVFYKSDGKRHSVKEKLLSPSIDYKGYYAVGFNKKGVYRAKHIHQLIAIAFLGHKPSGHKIVVDHINNIRTDNRFENLQLITHRENVSKDRKNGTSKYTGVCWNKQQVKWVSNIRIDGKFKYLGAFTNEYEAHLAYQNKLKEITNN